MESTSDARDMQDRLVDKQRMTNNHFCLLFKLYMYDSHNSCVERNNHIYFHWENSSLYFVILYRMIFTTPCINEDRNRSSQVQSISAPRLRRIDFWPQSNHDVTSIMERYEIQIVPYIIPYRTPSKKIPLRVLHLKNVMYVDKS